MNQRLGPRIGRRAWLAAVTALLAPALPGLAWAGVVDDDASDAARWLPYDPSEVKVLLPDTANRVIQPRRTLASEFLDVQEPAGSMRIDPVFTARRSHSGRVVIHPLRQPPTAYVVTGQRLGVPAWVLFGVALQESQLLFGHDALPYPWTLDIGGRAERHGNYQRACDALTGYLDRGVTNVDCGPMQVNWRAHRDKLGSAARALNPYLNLGVGARILRDNYAATGSWPQAVGLYHTGSFGSGERRARAVNYVAGVSRRLSRHGLTLAQAINASADRERRHG